MRTLTKKLSKVEREREYVIKNFKGKFSEMYAEDGIITSIKTDDPALITYLTSKGLG